MTVRASEASATGSLGTTVGRVLRLREFSVAVVAIIIAIIFQILNSNFLQTSEVQVLLAATAQYGLIAVGEAMLMITGEIDLSAAKIYSTVPFVMYYLTQAHVPFGIAILLGLVAGALIGLWNGVLTVKVGIPSLIATLGTLFLLNGITLWVSASQPVRTPVAQPLNTIFGLGQTDPSLGGLTPYAGFIWLLLVVVVLTVTLQRTRFGLHTISVGSNMLASREIGIRTDEVKIANFMIMGVLAGLCGLIQSAASGSIDPSAGDNTLTLYGIAAAVIGGTSLFGGSGTIVGALIGAYVISALNNGLPLVGAQAGVSDAILGAAIIGAMILNIQITKLRTRRR